MADPTYIDSGTGVLVDGDAWVALSTSSPAGNPMASDASAVVFESTTGTNNWSQYMDLFIVWFARVNASVQASNPKMVLNDDTATSYRYQRFYGAGSTPFASQGAYTGFAILGYVTGASESDTDMAASGITNIKDINSGKSKTIMSHWSSDTDGDGKAGVYTTLWANQQPVNKISIQTESDEFIADSRFDLFGVLPRMVQPGAVD
jgi:hypothetical protein